MKVSIVLYEEAVLSAVSSAIDLINGANQVMHRQSTKRKDFFELSLVSAATNNVNISGARFKCTKNLKDNPGANLVIIPPFTGTSEDVIASNGSLVKWLSKINCKRMEVASLCLGSYFLAEARLLDGKEATSHWMAIADMQSKYPLIKVLPDAVITDYRGIYTSGGAFSSLNLILYIVEKFAGHQIAIELSREFSIDIDRVSQGYFALFQGQRDHTDEKLHKAQSYIEKNYNKEISVDHVASYCNMSRRNFVRRFKDAAQNTPLEYIQRVKIESAKKRFENGQNDVISVMLQVGYYDHKSFRSLFKRMTGLNPQAYWKKYAAKVLDSATSP
jgi:transcriptional regulator GlxA family with amidase domain